MKLKLLLCAAALAVAGCASNNNTTDAYATYGEFGFSYDLVPPPVPGLTAADIQQMYGTTTITPAVYSQMSPNFVTPTSIYVTPSPVIVPGQTQAPVVPARTVAQ